MITNASGNRRNCECGNPIAKGENGWQRCLEIENNHFASHDTCGVKDQSDKMYGLMADVNRACKAFFQSRGIVSDEP